MENKNITDLTKLIDTINALEKYYKLKLTYLELTENELRIKLGNHITLIFEENQLKKILKGE